MRRTIIPLLACLLLAAAVDRSTPAEAFRPAAGVALVREDKSAGGDGVIAWGERWIITAYCPCEVCCGRWAHYNGGGWTASGARARAGVTVAVDPGVVPLGSRVWIEGIGWRIAHDTGSAVKGRHVDVYMNGHMEAARFGVQRRMVVAVEQ